MSNRSGLKILPGTVIMAIGVFLLLFTFVITTNMFLSNDLMSGLPSNMVQTFGETLAPAIALLSHAVYLGIMVWIGSELTIHGIDLRVKEKKTESQTTA
jgi:hypothetical protein